MMDIRLKIYKYAEKLFQVEKDKWNSGFKNEYAQAEEAFNELKAFYEAKGLFTKDEKAYAVTALISINKKAYREQGEFEMAEHNTLTLTIQVNALTDQQAILKARSHLNVYYYCNYIQILSVKKEQTNG